MKTPPCTACGEAPPYQPPMPTHLCRTRDLRRIAERGDPIPASYLLVAVERLEEIEREFGRDD